MGDFDDFDDVGYRRSASWEPPAPASSVARMCTTGFVIGIVVIVCMSAYWSSVHMPEPLPDTVANTTFSEQRARTFARQLCQSAHSTGTAAEEAIADRIMSMVQQLADEAPNNFVVDIALRRNNPGASIEDTTVMWWSEMNNIIVTLTPIATSSSRRQPTMLKKTSSSSNAPALMLSSHYDTVVLSPGCYDDTSGVAVQLEIMRNLLHSDATRYPIIFSFVSGEEIGLLGAFAFSQSDPLRHNVTAFIDMDSTPGNKAGLFLSTGSLLDELYAQAAARPFGSVFQNDMLNSPVVSSLTDWMTYSDAGMAGIGLGYSNKRIFYHTTQDVYRMLQLGSLQQFGDAILPVTLSAANSPKLTQPAASASYVFFDLFQTHMVLYSLSTAQVLQCLLAVAYLIVLSLVVVRPQWSSSSSSSSPFRTPSPIQQLKWCTLMFLTLILDFLLALAFSCLFFAFMDAVLPPLWFQGTPVLLGLTSAILSTLLILSLHEYFLVRLGRLLHSRSPSIARHFQPVAIQDPFSTLLSSDNDSASILTDPHQQQQQQQRKPNTDHQREEDEEDKRQQLITSDDINFAFQLYGVSWWFCLLTLIFVPVSFFYGSSYLVFWPALFVFLVLFFHEIFTRCAANGYRFARWTSNWPASFLLLLSLLIITFPACVLSSTIVPVFSVILIGTSSSIFPTVFLFLIVTLLVFPLLPLFVWSCSNPTARKVLYTFFIAALLVLFFTIVVFPLVFTTGAPLGVYVSQRVYRTPVQLTEGVTAFDPAVTSSVLRLRSALSAKQLKETLQPSLNYHTWSCPGASERSNDCTTPVPVPPNMRQPTIAVTALDVASMNISFAANFPCNTVQLEIEPRPTAWSFSSSLVQNSLFLVGGFGGLGEQEFWMTFPEHAKQVKLTLQSNQDSIDLSPAMQDFIAQMPSSIIATGRGSGLLTTVDEVSVVFSS